jgi:hypothetical protein
VGLAWNGRFRLNGLNGCGAHYPSCCRLG